MTMHSKPALGWSFRANVHRRIPLGRRGYAGAYYGGPRAIPTGFNDGGYRKESELRTPRLKKAAAILRRHPRSNLEGAMGTFFELLMLASAIVIVVELRNIFRER